MYMNILAANGCATSDGCHLPHHPGYAWAFAIIFAAGLTIYALAVARRIRRAQKQAGREGIASGRTDDRQEGQNKKASNHIAVYDLVQPRAKDVKAVLQMAVGIITVTAIGWRYVDTFGGGGDPTSLFLNGIGIGLAAAAALELAYTLFTDGPDEALDPLMLGIASTLLLKIAKLTDPVSLSQVGALAVLGLLLIGLFAARLMLAESADEQPRIWWIRRLNTQQVHPGPSTPNPDAPAPRPRKPQVEESNA